MKQNSDALDKLLSLKVLSTRYGRPSYWTWRRLVISGALPSVRFPTAGVRSRILVRARDVERFIDSSTEADDT